MFWVSLATIANLRYTSLQHSILLKVGDSVLVSNSVGNRKWLNGVIKSQTGPVSFKALVNGQIRCCHLDQLKLRLCNSDLDSRDTVGLDQCLEVVDSSSPPCLMTVPELTLQPLRHPWFVSIRDDTTVGNLQFVPLCNCIVV